MSQYESLKTTNCLVTMVATDDKAELNVGEPDMPIVACQHPGKSWIPSDMTCN